MNKKIHIFALAATGLGISGGDRIFIEFARKWSKECQVIIYVWEEGFKMCQRQNLNEPNIAYKISSMQPWKNFGFLINYLARIIEGIKIGLSLRLSNDSETIIYSASEFWMDSLTALFLKLRYPNVKWVASWYQSAPNPLKGFTQGSREEKYYISSLIYWFIQLPIKPLISKFADFILVNNQLETKKFMNLRANQKVLVILGALDLEKIRQYKKKYKNVKKIYDGVFQGRFHPQKGVVELVDIWKMVVNEKPDAKLAMIGDGPLMEEVKKRIKRNSLEKNIDIFGYLFDGPQKYKIFAQSRIVLHPSFYDSGGMASAEAMAFGLPAIGFNLKSYEDYYPKGMIKIEIGNLDKFSQEVTHLLSESKLYKDIARQSEDMIQINWSFKIRADQLMKELN